MSNGVSVFFFVCVFVCSFRPFSSPPGERLEHRGGVGVVHHREGRVMPGAQREASGAGEEEVLARDHLAVGGVLNNHYLDSRRSFGGCCFNGPKPGMPGALRPAKRPASLGAGWPCSCGPGRCGQGSREWDDRRSPFSDVLSCDQDHSLVCLADQPRVITRWIRHKPRVETDVVSPLGKLGPRPFFNLGVGRHVW